MTLLALMPVRGASLAIGAAVLATSACSDPQCPPGRVLVGTACVRTGQLLDAATGEDGSVAAFDSGARSEVAPDANRCDQPTQACTAGERADCTTVCGTRGSGLCSLNCQSPSGDQCAPPTESCNGIDDDCDGVIDRGLTERLPSGVHVWTGDSDKAVSIALLPRGTEGLWMLYKAGSTSEITAQALDRNGAVMAAKQVLTGTADSRIWTAASDGSHLALAASQSAGNDGAKLALRLYDAVSLRLVDVKAELEAKDCASLTPTSLSLATDDGGNVRLALLRTARTGLVDAQGVCSFPQMDEETTAYFGGIALDGSLTPPTPALLFPDSGFYSSRVVRVPCANEWLIGSMGSTKALRRYSFAGRPISAHDDVLVGGFMWDLGAALTGSCPSNTATFHLLASTTISAAGVGPTALTELALDRTTGKITNHTSTTVDPGNLSSCALTRQGGRIFVTGLDIHSALRLFEVSPGAEFTQIDLRPIDVVRPQFDLRDYSIDAFHVTAVAWAGNALVVGTGETPLFTGAANYRDTGDVGNPVAVAYQVGCR